MHAHARVSASSSCLSSAPRLMLLLLLLLLLLNAERAQQCDALVSAARVQQQC